MLSLAWLGIKIIASLYGVLIVIGVIVMVPMLIVAAIAKLTTPKDAVIYPPIYICDDCGERHSPGSYCSAKPSF